ncbi:MAG: hypothetical protein AABW41_00405 [Nanoarchaeota archaeon]
MKITTKAQMESMGLAIVVVILVVIALIALRFVLISDSPASIDSFLSNKANNIANSIKNADLCGSRFERAIIACCSKESFCDKEACKLVSDETNEIIKNGDEPSYVEALDGNGNKCFSVGSCVNGISSSDYLLENNILFRVRVCRK